MNEEKPKSGQEQQPNDAGGFKFAITLLAALGTISYAVYNHIQNNAIDPQWYVFVCGLIPIATILFGGLLLYILFKGYSMEILNTDLRKIWQHGASRIYLAVFTVFMLSLVSILCVLLRGYFKIENTLSVNVVIIVITLLVGVAFNFPLIKQKRSQGLTFLSFLFYCLFALLIGLLIWLALFPSVLNLTPLQGHVTVNMEGIYHKSDSQIPVLIHVTGPNTGLAINLVNETSDNDFHTVDSIRYLKPDCNTTKTTPGENSTLVGNALNYGIYNVFINTTDLTEGYYELRCVRRVLRNETYGARGFYLVNENAPLNTSHE